MLLRKSADDRELWTVFADTLLITLVFLVLYIQSLSIEAAASAEEAASQAEDLVKQGEIVAGLKDQVANGEKAREDAEEAIGKLEQGQPVDFVAVIDCSASMGDAIAKLKRVILMLCELLPRVTEFRCGLVLYRDGDIRCFELVRIEEKETDEGVSLDDLKAYLVRVSGRSAVANIEEGIEEGLLMFERSASSDTRCILAVLGDVGPGEYWDASGNAALRSLSDQEAARGRIVDSVDEWTSHPEHDRRVLALYSGVDNNPQKAFFEQLGQVHNGRFGDQPSEMFQTTFEAIFAPSGSTD